jgi:hypothetical protein
VPFFSLPSAVPGAFVFEIALRSFFQSENYGNTERQRGAFLSVRDEKKSREAFFFFRRLFFSRSRRRRRANVARSFVSPRRLNLLTFHAPSKKNHHRIAQRRKG